MKSRKTDSMVNQIRQAIDDSGISRYRISQETGIDESALAKFYNRKRGLSLENLNRLFEYLELEIVSKRRTPRKGR